MTSHQAEKHKPAVRWSTQTLLNTPMHLLGICCGLPYPRQQTRARLVLNLGSSISNLKVDGQKHNIYCWCCNSLSGCHLPNVATEVQRTCGKRISRSNLFGSVSRPSLHATWFID